MAHLLTPWSRPGEDMLRVLIAMGEMMMLTMMTMTMTVTVTVTVMIMMMMMILMIRLCCWDFLATSQTRGQLSHCSVHCEQYE